MRTNRALTGLLLALSAAPAPAAAGPQEPQDESRPALEHYNLGKHGLAVGGYDPVAYFPAGGGKPRKGKAELELAHHGVVYRFANEQNRKTFVASPARFEPLYGGWCAYAMAKGKKVEVDEESFVIEDGRLLLFYDGLFSDTRKKWLEAGEGKLRPKADAEWKRISGEGPARDLRHFNLEGGLALSGYDPVSYHAGGGVRPREGRPQIAATYRGVTYRFASEENRKAFLASPERYEAHYGGYCAWAMARGKEVEVDPQAYLLGEDGLFLFFDASKRDAWKAGLPAVRADADRAWKELHRRP